MEFISSQESAAFRIYRSLFLAEESVTGSGSGALMALERAGLSGAANSLTMEEIAALQRDYPSDDTASTISLDQDDPSVPVWTLAAAIDMDPIFGFAEPIIVSSSVPETYSDVPNPFSKFGKERKGP